MKKNVIILALAILTTGCSFLPAGYLGHTTNTQVVLSEANYKIIGSVTGEASAMTVLGIGLGIQPLYAEAKKQLMKKVSSQSLHNKSIALINFTSDERMMHVGSLMMQKTVTISADIIEFIPEEN